jgi:uncharacterized BrkB/YihY/UPF0761 family membrane protein
VSDTPRQVEHDPARTSETAAPARSEPAVGASDGSSLRARRAALAARGRALRARLEHERPRHDSVDVGFRWLVRDKEIAGGVLGGGLAYRFFFWTLALSLLGAGGLGFASRSHADIDEAVAEAGLSDAVGNTIQTAARQSENGRWWLLCLGVYFTVWFSWSLLRALRLVHAAAWRVTVPPLRNTPKAVGLVVVAPFVLAAAAAASGWVRSNAGPFPGFLATLAVALAFGVAWLWVSTKLPAPPGLPWTAFLPGAVVFAVGLEALHVFTAYFLANKLAAQSALYGALGVAASLLFYLFLVGRGVVWSAELNAIVWEARNRSEYSRERS